MHPRKGIDFDLLNFIRTIYVSLIIITSDYLYNHIHL